MVVLFSLRPFSNGVIYQVLNKDGDVASEMTFDVTKDIFKLLDQFKVT